MGGGSKESKPQASRVVGWGHYFQAAGVIRKGDRRPLI